MASVFQKLGSLNSEPALPSTSYLPATPSVVPASSYVPNSETPPGERPAPFPGPAARVSLTTWTSLHPPGPGRQRPRAACFGGRGPDQGPLTQGPPSPAVSEVGRKERRLGL